MNHLHVIFEVLIGATVVLAAGILMIRRPDQSLRSAFEESLGWSAGFFICYSTAIMMFDTLHRNVI